MKGKDECTWFGKSDIPPEDAECKECPDANKCIGKVWNKFFPYERRQHS